MGTNVLGLGLIFFVTVLVFVCAHVIPWRLIPPAVNERGELYPVAAYIVGTSLILIVFAVWCLLENLAAVWVVLFVICAGAGAGTVAPRVVKWIDARVSKAGAVDDLRDRLAKAERDNELLRQRVAELSETHSERPNS